MDLLLGRALALSLMLHAFALAYLGTRLPQGAAKPPLSADLSVFLREEKPAAPPPPPLEAIAAQPHPTPAPPARAALKRGKKPPPREPVPAARALYPLEAVARGLEGVVMVRIRLDERGNVVASRLEASSGHALLDEAALQAVRTLRALPDAMVRETVLPVRFRLR